MAQADGVLQEVAQNAQPPHLLQLADVHGVELLPCPVAGCADGFKNVQNLKVHLRTHGAGTSQTPPPH